MGRTPGKAEAPRKNKKSAYSSDSSDCAAFNGYDSESSNGDDDRKVPGKKLKLSKANSGGRVPGSNTRKKKEGPGGKSRKKKESPQKKEPVLSQRDNTKMKDPPLSQKETIPSSLQPTQDSATSKDTVICDNWNDEVASEEMLSSSDSTTFDNSSKAKKKKQQRTDSMQRSK
jgi:hypothetical protein